MRALLAIAASALLASAAFAQSATAPVYVPESPVVTTPKVGASSSDLTQQLQKALGSKNQGQALQQGFAVAALLGCTSKQAGRVETDNFYRQMQLVGKQVEGYCKAKQAPQARALVLETLKNNKTNPVLTAANNCYGQQKQNLEMMAGPILSHDLANYARWTNDPATAEREMKDSDICR